MTTELLVQYLYVLAGVLFILSLKGMSEVRTARWGNWAGSAGMLLAIIATLLAYRMERYDLLIGAVIVGALIGVPI
ncbi:MAG: NAD(P)(+) transhydrogenase (Re/Si-specific) subunit beta, partial [Armatimonadetes bacterium]|nr:NAD(P)(+) transhydrogenase (Re/Si-specific) subunit beta [Armatimonadota bacterium]